MGYLAAADSQNHLPQTPPDFTSSYSSSHASFPSARYSSQRQPPQDLSWPHPKPPISPPMSSHDQPPSRLAKLPSPVRPSSSGSGIMSTATSAPWSAISGRPSRITTADPSPASSPRKNDARRPPVRETLPSLSSIFGPPENIRPLHPSPLERPRGDSLTPSGPPMSLPMDQRHSPSFSYFPKVATPPASVSTLSQSTQPLPQPPRSVYQDDHSPRQESASRKWSDPRSGYTVANRWAPHQDSSSSSSSNNNNNHNRAEHASYSENKPQYADSQKYTHAHSPTDSRGPAPPDYHRRQHEQPSSYGSHRDHPHPPQFSPPPPMGMSRSPVRGPGPVASMLPTPSASAYPDGATIPKEGMGPKIWTGVDFLPQFMRAAEVPGEGLCFFYDDGSHCKAVIDGETVNPYWGVTKAGKPRKRLAIACMTCREKKIKCDPEYPRCVQCEKFGRVCRFKNAPRGGNNMSPGTASSEPANMRKAGPMPMIRPPPESPRAMAYASNSASSPRAGLRRPSSPDRMDSGSAVYKRVRTDYDHYTTASRGRSPPYGNVSPTSSSDAPRASSALPPAPWGHDSCYTRDNTHAPSSASYSQISPQPQPQPQPSYQRHHYDDYRHAQPSSPPHPEPPRTLLPPPRSGPEVPRMHSDGMARSWPPEL